MDGTFIVFEGGEGSGKSTQAALLKERLPNDTVYTREPGGTPIGDAIRQILLDPTLDAMSTSTEMMLFCAARAENVRTVIQPALAEGRVVVADRFDLSTFAYQIYGRECPEYRDLFEACNGHARAGLKPDICIYMDIDPSLGLDRVHRRPDEDTRFDQEELDFHTRVRNGYLALCSEREECVVVDASRSIEEVQQDVLEALHCRTDLVLC